MTKCYSHGFIMCCTFLVYMHDDDAPLQDGK